MRIPPVPELGILVNIFLTNVKAAHISDAVIDYHDLTVIPVIDPKMQPANQGRKEFGTLNSFLFPGCFQIFLRIFQQPMES